MNPYQPMVDKIGEVQIAWERTGLHLLTTDTAVKQVTDKMEDYMVLSSLISVTSTYGEVSEGR